MKARSAWIVVVAVAASVAVVPALRQRGRDHLRTLRRAPVIVTGLIRFSADERLKGEYQVVPGMTNQEFIAAVETKWPDDPDSLLAAGALVSEAAELTNVDGPTPEGNQLRAQAIRLLTQAIQKGVGGAAYSVYVTTLLRDMRYDPDLPEVEKTSGQPASHERSDTAVLLDAQQAQEIVKVLDAWAAEEPENGAPVALRAWVLYGINQPEAAFETWKQAALRLKVCFHDGKRNTAAIGLFERLGYSSPDAVTWSLPVTAMLDPAFKIAWVCRVAEREGKREAQRGEVKDAVALWTASADIGHHMQECADDYSGHIMGLIIERIGADPAWTLVQDEHRRRDKTPYPRGGQYYWGEHHALFARQVGDAADRALRDRLVANSQRDIMFGDQYYGSGRFQDMANFAGDVHALMVYAAVLLAQALLLIAGMAIARVAAHRPRPATTISGVWQFLFALPTAALIAPGLIASGIATLATRHARPEGQGFLGSWRANLREVVPIAITVTAIAYLAVTIVSVRPTERFMDEHRIPEMQWVISKVGPAWNNPPISPDSWRAEYALPSSAR